MSSRKRKNRSEPASGADKPTAAPPDDAGETGAAGETARETVETIDEAPREAAEAVVSHSHINELKPRRGAEAELEVHEEAEDEALAEDEEAEAATVAVKAPTSRAQLKRVLESLIFVSDQIISAQQLARIAKVKSADVRELVAELSVDYEGRGIELVEVGGGFQFRSAAVAAPFVQSLVAQRPTRLTRAQLETLALIAYRQPITRPEIDDVRGVDSGSAVKVLLERELVKILGRKDEAGRPLLYGTTPFFLEFFGMNSMKDLPTLREFTELTQEHRELFQRKTGEVPDLSAEAVTAAVSDGDVEGDHDHEDELAGATEGEEDFAPEQAPASEDEAAVADDALAAQAEEPEAEATDLDAHVDSDELAAEGAEPTHEPDEHADPDVETEQDEAADDEPEADSDAEAESGD